MGVFLSTLDKSGGRSVKAQEHSRKASVLARVVPKKMQSNWILGGLTRQKMKEIIGTAPFKSEKDYIATIERLIAREASQSFDGHATATASNLERQANKILMAIKKRDETEVYDKFRDKAGRKRAPGDHFLGVVDIINKTELLKVARRIPKGAHLHCHFNSCLLPTFLIGIAKDIKAMHIRSTLPLSCPENIVQAEISFQTLPPQQPANLFDPDYEPLSWMNYQDFWRIFPGGYPAAESWLVSKMLLTEEEVYELDQTGKGSVT
jgi:adenosine deaminase CECR1